MRNHKTLLMKTWRVLFMLIYSIHVCVYAIALVFSIAFSYNAVCNNNTRKFYAYAILLDFFLPYSDFEITNKWKRDLNSITVYYLFLLSITFLIFKNNLFKNNLKTSKKNVQKKNLYLFFLSMWFWFVSINIEIACGCR